MSQKQKAVSFLAKNRIIVQIIFGALIYIGISNFNISLWWILLFGAITGIIWGKVFCRWMCPLGIIMELMTKMSPNDSLRSMYQYHKIGCPIAWISGFLNKVSFFKIQLNKETCKNCGVCDSACYMPILDEKKYSLYKSKMLNPSEAYSCSKCLQCVAECPNGSLTYKFTTKNL